MNRTAASLGALVAIAIAFATLPASAARRAEVTVFTGRFVCDASGTQVPLAGARVSIVPVSKDSSGLGFHGDTFFSAADSQRALTGADGGFRFQVPFASSDNTNYLIEAALDNGRGTVVRDWPSPDPVTISTGTNQNDVPEQNYGTQIVPGDECAVWLAFQDAVSNYYQLTGRGEGIEVNYDGPNEGDPWTDYLTVQWPRGYAADSFASTEVAALHEFAHMLRNASLGNAQRADEALTGFDFEKRRDPCTRTGPALAFYDGFAEFWAHDYAPAPACAGVAETDESVEGMVAWRLVKMERFCQAASRQQIAATLFQYGAAIQSLSDLISRLPACQPGGIDSSKIASFATPASVLANRYADDMRALLHSAQSQSARLGAQLTNARLAAELAKCPPFPCTRAIAAKVAPAILTQELAQEHTVMKTLNAQLSSSGPPQPAAPTAQFLQRVLETPSSLGRELATICVHGTSNALAAARLFASEDHSRPSRELVADLISLRNRYAQAADGGPRDVFLNIDPIGGTQRAHRITITGHKPTHRLLTFGELETGTTITDQVAGATFGSAQSIGFPGAVPSHVCAAAPTAEHAGPALAPTCPGGPTGYITAGTMARLASPAHTVSVRVGATQTMPGGFSAELDAFTANGSLLDEDAVLVGSSTNGQSVGLARTLQVSAGHTGSIVYIAVFLNSYWTPGPNLAFDDLDYTSP